MRSRMRLLAVIVGFGVLAFPVHGYAQEATIAGAITDETGGVLPGVTVTAIHTDSGNVFTTVSDERGSFRLPVRTGVFRLSLELTGFGTVQRTLELLVGQQPVLNLTMSPSSVQETVTVTGEAPLINTQSSTLSGNVDTRQMEQLPVNGRSWQDLVLLAPGSRANTSSDAPVERFGGGTYQLNVDGQQVTQVITQSTIHGNPKFSRDAIAEFEFISNRFDSTQGRSMGVQVNAITKSGTNDFRGTFASYFRDDRFNAADPVSHVVLPYSDQQVSSTFGGPIRRDRLHFFGNYEFEREPQSLTFTTPYPSFNKQLSSNRHEYTGGGRLDAQLSPQTRLTFRNTNWRNRMPNFGLGINLPSASATPAGATETVRWAHEYHGTLLQQFGNSTVSELRAGFARYAWRLASNNISGAAPDLVLPDGASTRGATRVLLRGGLIVGQGNQFSPQEFEQDNYSIRENLTHSFSARGRHTLKLGAEYLYYPIEQYFCNFCFGELQADTAVPPANLADLFPNLLDSRTWNLAPLSSISIRYKQGFGKFAFTTPRHVYAGWAQDDWTISNRLTVNLGIRYDLQTNVWANDVEILPFLPGGRPNDTNNIQPRLGFAYTVDDRTVVRGGYGLFYGDVQNTGAFSASNYAGHILAEVVNDGRPDFAVNPYNTATGRPPTYDQIVARLCTPAAPFTPGCIRPSLAGTNIPGTDTVVPYSHQTSIGLQRQLGSTLAVTADYVFTGARKVDSVRNSNLRYNPVTKTNYGSRDLANLPYPYRGLSPQAFSEGFSNQHSLDTSLTKRFAQRWQMSATYSLSGFWDEQQPVFRGVELPDDLGPEYTLATTDQRHRAVLNGIYDVGRGFQVSGLYFFGSGQRFITNWGPDLRDVGFAGSNRLRPNGTIVPRNNLVGHPLHRVDLRLQERVPLGRGVTIDGVLEVFNVLNHDNFGSYTTSESNPRFGQPNINLAVAYLPRTLQLGFRVAF